ncbi:MAG TPA: hypothetical protein VHG51_03960 [Longimicrobiaceae bacterium]|nr:hypothetical protein [Longimicrobiaceae bacterium]
MTGPAYPAARAVAAPLEAHFGRAFAAAQADAAAGADPAPPPDAAAVEALVDAAFWASLRREEGYAPRISLAYLPPERAEQPLRFERRLPLAPAALTRVAPAVERPGIHLGVWRDGDVLSVWGACRSIPPLSFVLEVVQPGLLVVKHRRRRDSGKFVNVAVLLGDQVRLVDEEGASLSDCPALLAAMLGFDAPASWAGSVNLLVDLAVSMRAHGRGGSLLVVPDGSRAWRESIVEPMPYAVVPPFTRLADLMRGDSGERGPSWREALRRTVEGVAGLTAVDGATVMTEGYELLGFGAKIGRREGGTPVDRVTLTEPTVGNAPAVLHPSQIGGTRHLSAAQFVHDQRDALALVASQDGRFTVFAWSPCEEMVHAHRVETLLL